MKKVSVIIPVYNGEEFIEASINSMLNQTYNNLEIIVCNDASKDNSKEVILSLKDDRIKYVENEENLGYLKTINKLFSLANGEFIAFQDADDISAPERIAIQIKKLQEKELDLIGTNFNIINEKGTVVRRNVNVITESEEINEKLLERNIFQKPSILFKTAILNKVGGYRTEFLKLKNISEDYDWLLRIREAGFKLGNVNGSEALFNYRSVSTAMTKGFTHVEQLFGEKIAIWLAKERLEGKQDAIERKDFSELKLLIEKWKKPYLEDTSLFYIQRAETQMYAGLNKEAIKYALEAVKQKPFSIRNIRTLQYCLRKTLFKT